MKTIGVWSSKGGCGKSTIAQNLAGYFYLKRIKSAIVDLDKEQGTSEWLGKQGKVNFPVVRKENIGDLKGYKPAVVIADYPANVAGVEMFESGMSEDLIICPLRPSPADLLAVSRHIKNGQENILFVVNGIDMRRKIDRDFIPLLRSKFGNSVLTLNNRSIYVRALAEGCTVFNMKTENGAAQAQHEVRVLGDYVCKKLGIDLTL